MSTQHTPGPWIGAGPSFGDPFPRYTTSIVTEWEHDDEGIVEICELPFHHRDDENEANARLIAAAPDLLNALVMVLDDPQALDGRPRTAEVVREAIAKATGEQP
jgi:hypothetical protein